MTASHERQGRAFRTDRDRQRQTESDRVRHRQRHRQRHRGTEAQRGGLPSSLSLRARTVTCRAPEGAEEKFRGVYGYTLLNGRCERVRKAFVTFISEQVSDVDAQFVPEPPSDICMHTATAETGRDRERDRDREAQRETERQRERERERERATDRERATQAASQPASQQRWGGLYWADCGEVTGSRCRCR